jgi:hypothetical protein
MFVSSEGGRAMSVTHEIITVEEATTDQAHVIFDQRCRRALGVSGDEFLAVFQSGEYPAEWDEQKINEVEMLLPFAH